MNTEDMPANPDCNTFCAVLEEWLAGELPDAAARGMQRHHDHCHACRFETKLAREIEGLTRALPAEQMPPAGACVLPQTGHATSGVVGRFVQAWRQPLVFVPAALLVLALLGLPALLPDAPAPRLIEVGGQVYTEAQIIEAAADLELALRYLDKYGNYPARVVHAELDTSRPPPARDDAPSI